MSAPSGATPNPSAHESVPSGEPVEVTVNDDGSTYECVRCPECGAMVGDTHWVTESTNKYIIHWEDNHPSTLASWRAMTAAFDAMKREAS